MSILKKHWENAKREMIEVIDYIEQETPWSANEPKWWLEMMKIRALISNPERVLPNE